MPPPPSGSSGLLSKLLPSLGLLESIVSCNALLLDDGDDCETEYEEDQQEEEEAEDSVQVSGISSEDSVQDSIQVNIAP